MEGCTGAAANQIIDLLSDLIFFYGFELNI